MSLDEVKFNCKRNDGPYQLSLSVIYLNSIIRERGNFPLYQQCIMKKKKDFEHLKA